MPHTKVALNIRITTPDEGRGWSPTKFNAEMRTKGYEDKKVRVGDQTPRVWVDVKLVSTISADHFMGNVEVL